MSEPSQFQFWRNAGSTVGAAVLGTILAQRLPEAIGAQIARVNLPPAFKNVLPAAGATEREAAVG